MQRGTIPLQILATEFTNPTRNRVKLDWTAVDDAIATYFRAWNEQDPDQRRRPLEGCVTADAVLVDPTGRWEGVTGLAQRSGAAAISRLHPLPRS